MYSVCETVVYEGSEKYSLKEFALKTLLIRTAKH